VGPSVIFGPVGESVISEGAHIGRTFTPISSTDGSGLGAVLKLDHPTAKGMETGVTLEAQANHSQIIEKSAKGKTRLACPS